jgi:di/tricarboxylate transporter
MWLSNTATTLMLMPMVVETINGMKPSALEQKSDVNESDDSELQTPLMEDHHAQISAFNDFSMAVPLGVAYSASLGGLLKQHA